MRSADFVETDLTDQTDVMIPYSVTNIGVPSDTGFYFQGNLVKVSRIPR
jgi:hypothetical protein